MARAAGLVHDDAPQAKLGKLDAVLAQTSTSKQDATLFAEMLSLPNDGRYPALELTPQQRRQKTLEALTEQLAGLASQHPVLMIFEDLHWIDPTSVEALNRAVGRIKTLPALLIVTFRPEFNAPWLGQSRVTSLTLTRLGEVEAAERRLELRLRPAHHRGQYRMGELPPDRRPDLGHLLGRTEPVEPGHQRCVQACGNRTGRGRNCSGQDRR